MDHSREMNYCLQNYLNLKILISNKRLFLLLKKLRRGKTVMQKLFVNAASMYFVIFSISKGLLIMKQRSMKYLNTRAAFVRILHTCCYRYYAQLAYQVYM